MSAIRLEEIEIPIIRMEFGSGVDYGLTKQRSGWFRGVRFHDASNGVVIDVIPADGEMPRFYSEIAIYGALPTNPKPLSRRWLNARARLFLAQQDEPEDTTPRRKTLRPDDATLVALVIAAYEAGESPRQMLSREFWVSVNTVDDWIKRARAVAPEYGEEIPAPTRGRGHAPAAKKPALDSDAYN